MAQAKTAVANKPLWADLSSPDAEASRKFYSTVFGWKIEVNPDPQYGGYGMAKVADKQVAGIGPKMSPDAPTAWSIYIGTDDIDGLAKKVEAAGGKVVAPPFDVGDQGRMGAFQDLRMATANHDGQLPGWRSEHVRLGRVECARRRQGHPLLSEGIRLDAEGQ